MANGKRDTESPVEILLVEDNEADAHLMKMALAKEKQGNRVSVVTDGENALDFLYKRGNHTNAVRPDLIMLDLNLPRKDGREVLEEIKGNPALKKIPVIIVTTSESDDDVDRSYSLHANCYVTKPVGATRFFEVVKSVMDFWFGTARLPSKEET